jgi:mannosyltransferase OCH1-like enzyme
MHEMAKREFNGVADMLRWEILFAEGGFVVDADSICLRPLDDTLFECEAFACWENEIVRPGLIAAGYFACSAKNSFVGRIILDIHNEPSVVNDMAWKTVGPQRLTAAHKHYVYDGLTILPSHLFIPEHYSGERYTGDGPVYAHQAWGSTHKAYDTLHLAKFDGTGHVEVAVEKSPLEAMHDPYFVQRISVSREFDGRSRLDVFAQLCTGKRVMHIGCADWPITDPHTSLHLALEPNCARLDGFDIHVDSLVVLATHTKGRLYTRIEDIVDEYDIVLVPEVLEHVPDTALFLRQLHKLKTSEFVITVPDAYSCFQAHFHYVASSKTFVEVVHPDHNCWYTPYTLSNVLSKYTPWKVDGLWFFNNISLLARAHK